MLTTGMSISGKMSVAMRFSATGVASRISIAITMKVYGRRSASSTTEKPPAAGLGGDGVIPEFSYENRDHTIDCCNKRHGVPRAWPGFRTPSPEYSCFAAVQQRAYRGGAIQEKTHEK